MQWKCKGAFSERLEQGLLLSFSSITHNTAVIDYTGVAQLLKHATSEFLCVLLSSCGTEFVVFFERSLSFTNVTSILLQHQSASHAVSPAGLPMPSLVLPVGKGLPPHYLLPLSLRMSSLLAPTMTR